MLVLTIVDMKAVDSTKDSRWLWLRVDGSLEESRTVALVASGRLYRRESNSGSGCEWTALRKRADSGSGYKWTPLWKRVYSGSEVVGSLEESKTAT